MSVHGALAYSVFYQSSHGAPILPLPNSPSNKEERVSYKPSNQQFINHDDKECYKGGAQVGGHLGQQPRPSEAPEAPPALAPTERGGTLAVLMWPGGSAVSHFSETCV